MIEVKDIRLDEISGGLKVVLEVSHTGPTKTLSQDLYLEIDGSRYKNRKVRASLDIKDLEAKDTKEALLKMAEWCRRMCTALEEALDGNFAEVPI